MEMSSFFRYWVQWCQWMKGQRTAKSFTILPKWDSWNKYTFYYTKLVERLKDKKRVSNMAAASCLLHHQFYIYRRNMSISLYENLFHWGLNCVTLSQLKYRPLWASGSRAFSLSSSAILRRRAWRSAADEESRGRWGARRSRREGSPKLLKSSGYSDSHVLNTVHTALGNLGQKHSHFTYTWFTISRALLGGSLTPFISHEKTDLWRVSQSWRKTSFEVQIIIKPTCNLQS